MMDHSRLFDRIPCQIVHAQAEATGWDSPYTADSVVRYYQTRTLADWHHDTNTTDDQVVIAAGIGTLTLTATAVIFSPRRPTDQPPPTPPPRPAPPTIAAERQAVCASCPRWESNRCAAAGCSCAQLGQANILASRCPLGRWKIIS